MCRMKNLTKRQVLDYRLRVLKEAQDSGVTAASRKYGVNRGTIYNWQVEIIPQKTGPKGVVPWQTDSEIEELVIQTKLSTNYGPKRIKDLLEDSGVSVGEKATRGILEAGGLVKKQRKPKKKTTQAFYAPYPGYRVQIDTKAVPVSGGGDKRTSSRQQFTAIDIVSKIRYLEVLDGLSNTNSLLFVKRALEFFADIGIKVECVQTDNHSTFTNLFSGGNKKSDHELRRVHMLTAYLISKGIEHKLSRPGTPQHNGFVERSHRTDEEEFYEVINTTRLNIEEIRIKIKQWQDEYNNLRRHSSCNNLPPVEYFNLHWRVLLNA